MAWRAEASAAHRALVEAWGEVTRAVGEPPSIVAGTARRIVELGAEAAAWGAAEDARQRQEKRAAQADASRRDIADQIAQFRGGLAASGVDSERRAFDLRERMAALGERIASQQEAGAVLVEELTRHLGDLPELRRAGINP